jgi:CMP-N-acetylneuraminic acid synthetase
VIVLGIIPARGGSKSIPLKNIKELCGKPLLAYAIESAKKSMSLDRLVVSTDHDRIASVAKEYGAEVILRPDELATDEASTEGALIHVLDDLKKREDYEPDIVLTLEPTSPFRSPQLIDRCIEIFKTTDADSIIGVVEVRSCIGRIVQGKFEFLFPGQPRRRQEREALYQESSTIYGTRIEIIRRKNSVLGDRLYPLIVSENEALDINTPYDFEIAELTMKRADAG